MSDSRSVSARLAPRSGLDLDVRCARRHTFPLRYSARTCAPRRLATDGRAVPSVSQDGGARRLSRCLTWQAADGRPPGACRRHPPVHKLDHLRETLVAWARASVAVIGGARVGPAPSVPLGPLRTSGAKVSCALPTRRAEARAASARPFLVRADLCRTPPPHDRSDLKMKSGVERQQVSRSAASPVALQNGRMEEAGDLCLRFTPSTNKVCR